ncbi:spore germination protein GerPB [Oceanobacillus manasiensis]|uniref:spore germination protein GerPB n=1 Tax=Oceanobacillus manasiensis TaxID=586413 RepID=UPI0005AB366B|nr:spore germination protein GerPB [Oceanobacillus manasiensis]
MNLTVHQSISIHMLKVGVVTNSSVLQIGSTGSFQTQSAIYNTGGFKEVAEEAEATGAVEASELAMPIVPLSR